MWSITLSKHSFDAQELNLILQMCDHEEKLFEQMKAMIPGLKVNGAKVSIASIATKAEAQIEAIGRDREDKAASSAEADKEKE